VDDEETESDKTEDCVLPEATRTGVLELAPEEGEVPRILLDDNDDLDCAEDKMRELARLDEDRVVERVELAEFRTEVLGIAGRDDNDVLRVLLNPGTWLTVELAEERVVDLELLERFPEVAEEEVEGIFVPLETARLTDELEATLLMLDVNDWTVKTEALVPEHIPNAD
jgi:hypothetical protein